ncbi:putative cystatin-9-like protein CST9LP1 [Tupaia chinensis]|uniref:Putative cystatin-9-like 2 n=1 Tax=Tupaia chinensis TaxID=246437 RepID=L8Y9S2_TUPCH|nr:putative cystatin-9-like protein CST9LP1 [Tupaia chinensis]ELV12977.1 Putative cystatin-9-like 2 [Tupaia chinensis]
MSRLPGTRALPRALLLLLVGFQLLPTPAWCSEGESKESKKSAISPYVAATVEFALHEFNQHSGDDRAYRLVRILSIWRAKEHDEMVISMNLQLRRTICRKSEEDIENCPFEENPGWNNTSTCFFTVYTEPWHTKFNLLDQTCSKAP